MKQFLIKNLFVLAGRIFFWVNGMTEAELYLNEYLLRYAQKAQRSNSTMDSLYSDISIHPSHWFCLSMRQKTDIKTGKNFRKSYGLNFKDGRFQGASISYLSYLDFNNYSYFSGWKRLNEKLNSSISALYDLDKSFLTYWRGRLEYKTSGSWVWDFSITQRVQGRIIQSGVLVCRSLDLS